MTANDGLSCQCPLCQKEAGQPASPPTVARRLGSHGYALHVNAKKLEAGADRPDRQAQLEQFFDKS